MNKHNDTLENRADAFIKDLNVLMKKRQVTMQPFINFKRKNKKIPLLSRLAIRIIVWQKGVIDMKFFDFIK